MDEIDKHVLKQYVLGAFDAFTELKPRNTEGQHKRDVKRNISRLTASARIETNDAQQLLEHGGKHTCLPDTPDRNTRS